MTTSPAPRAATPPRLGFGDFDDFLHRCRERLLPEPATEARRPNGDYRFEPPGSVPVEADPPRAAAVLVPVVERADMPVVLLTQRTDHLAAHSGQIALPGGKIDPADASPLAAALREAEEEIGLDRRFVRPLGYADPYLTGTNFFVVPTVGLVSPGYELKLNPDEVAEVFEVPLPVLMDGARYALLSREWQGRVRRFYALDHGGRRIWGVTAGILNNLRERLYPDAAPAPGGVRGGAP